VKFLYFIYFLHAIAPVPFGNGTEVKCIYSIIPQVLFFSQATLRSPAVMNFKKKSQHLTIIH